VENWKRPNRRDQDEVTGLRPIACPNAAAVAIVSNTCLALQRTAADRGHIDASHKKRQPSRESPANEIPCALFRHFRNGFDPV